MRRWLVQPVVWGVGLLAYWAGQLIDEGCELFDLDGEDH